MPAASSLIRRIFDQVFNQGNLDVVDELIAADIDARIASWGALASRLGLKQMIANLRSAFPDLRCVVEDEIREGDKLAAYWTMRGTHKGSYFGNQPTGRPIAVQGFIFARTADDQIVENQILIDQIGILQQIGVVPPSRGSL